MVNWYSENGEASFEEGQNKEERKEQLTCSDDYLKEVDVSIS